MGRSEVGTAKYQSKKLKASGLQKLKFYCQICQKQCRDSNGFKNHLNSPSHVGRVENLSKGDENVIEKYSQQLLKDFLLLLKINHGYKKINANKFYQEYILNDKDHVHMNSTKWPSLTQFIKFLGKNGHVRVEEEESESDKEFNLLISLIDSSNANYNKEKALKNDKIYEEKLNTKLINEQMEAGKQYLNKFHDQRNNKKDETKENPVNHSSNGNDSIKLNLKKPTKKVTKLSAFNDSDDDEEDNE